MPMLLEDLAEETCAGNRRVADRLEAEMRDLGTLPGAPMPPVQVQQKVPDSARQAMDYAIARVPQAEGLWRMALSMLRQQATGDEAEPLLRVLIGVFQSGQRLVGAARGLWQLANRLGIAGERLDELERAERQFAELSAEARGALEHRLRGWRPADPERLALGLQVAEQGNTVKAEDVRRWFRRTTSYVECTTQPLS